MAHQAGEKLGARLSQLMLTHNLALRRQLAPIEAKIHAASTQQLVDRLGLEVADLFSPITSALLEADPDMDPAAREFVKSAASGRHQWQAVAGHMVLGGVSGGLSTVLNNYLAPAVQRLVALQPNIHVDQSTAAAAAATGLTSYGDAESDAAQAGFDAANFALLYGLAQNVPSPDQINQLVNRQLIDVSTAFNWLRRNGIPPELLGDILALRQALLDPADAALAVLRGNMSQADGYAAAARQGVGETDFDVLIGNTGEPPAIEEMLMLWRRNEVSTPELERAITQSRIRNEWIPYILKLAIEPPSQADVLNARVQGQISDAEAQKRFAEAGGDPTWYAAAYDSTANSPSPQQLAEMANRGIIPWSGTGPAQATWQQGFLEGRWKDKWESAYKQLAVYHPPPREIATLVKEGGLNQDQAEALWAQAGLPPELVTLYWNAAHYNRTSTVHELAQGEIVKLYNDKAVTRDEATKMLESVNWTATDANWLLDIADLAAERSLLEKGIAKIGSLYQAWKIDRNAASAALATLEVGSAQVEQTIKIWDLERSSNVKVLTAAEITDAWFYQLITPQQAQAMLEQRGYSPYDAWLLLNIKNKGEIADFPPPG